MALGYLGFGPVKSDPAMGYTPVFLEMSGRPCVVIGGGRVAERRVRTLLEVGAAVTVVSPTLTSWLAVQVRSGRLRHLERCYMPGDLSGFSLAYAITDDHEVQGRISAEAWDRGVLINVADAPGRCSFIVPATIARGDLQIAISTGGASPALARRLRRELERQFAPEYAAVVAILRAARSHLRSVEPDATERASRLSALAASDLADKLRLRDFVGADRILAEHLDGMSLTSLGFSREKVNSYCSVRAGEVL